LIGGCRPNHTSYGVLPLGKAEVGVVLITYAINGSNYIHD